MSMRVCAVVVTYNRKALLAECLAALLRQTRPPEAILVVDNASTDGTRAWLRRVHPAVALLALEENRGGAGGFAAGLQHACDAGFDQLWIMDDDAVPAPECLAALLACRQADAVRVPLRQDRAGRLHGVRDARRGFRNAAPRIAAAGHPVAGDFTFSFVGPLLPRAVVARVGLPDAAFFIRYDDFEYALRIRAQGAAAIVAVPAARIEHELLPPDRTPLPAWKVYYDTRNMLYLFTRRRPSLQGLGWFARRQLRGLGRDLWLGRTLPAGETRRGRLALRLRGIRDGMAGRMGRRI